MERGKLQAGNRAFPEEMPIAVTVNGMDYAVMLASPADVIDFAYGFLLGEGLIRHAEEVESVEVTTRPDGMIARVSLHGDPPMPARRERRLAGVSSCGLCGVQSLQDAIKPMARAGWRSAVQQYRHPPGHGGPARRAALQGSPVPCTPQRSHSLTAS